MSDARTEILGRVRAALGEGRAPDVAFQRTYRRADPRPRSELVALLCERVNDYAAQALRIAGDGEVAAAVAAACSAWGVGRLAVAPELPAAWRPAGPELVEDHGLTARELDEIGGALTGCAAAIAETGTLVLDGRGACGRRALTLVPDHHICVVRADQIYGGVPEGLAAVADAVAAHRAPITLISGPSATSDIELERVEGVHGPRHLVVLIVE
jgi:L-lactate dehydrogenase complex protein LldG